MARIEVTSDPEAGGAGLRAVKEYGGVSNVIRVASQALPKDHEDVREPQEALIG